jgi:hypothetical protein
MRYSASGALDHRAELAHVARPVVRGQRGQQLQGRAHVWSGDRYRLAGRPTASG